MALKAVLFIIATLAIVGKATSESCGAQFRSLVHKTISLKESCDDAVFNDCCQVYCMIVLFMILLLYCMHMLYSLVFR